MSTEKDTQERTYRESNVLPRNLLLDVFLLLQLEDVFVEVELQVFVGVVDAQLLETVLLRKIATSTISKKKKTKKI